MKIETVNMTKSRSIVEIMAMGRSKNGPRSMVPMSVEADNGANITLLKAEMLQDLDWVQIRPLTCMFMDTMVWRSHVWEMHI